MPAPKTLSHAAATLAALTLVGCNFAGSTGANRGIEDPATCKALMALPEHKGCSLVIEFGPVAANAGQTRRAAVQAWIAAGNPAQQVQTREGAQGSARLCVTEPFDRDTDAAFEALKPIGSTPAAGSMRLCTNTGRSFWASDPVDHGGDEVRR